MNSTQRSNDIATEASRLSAVPTRFEVTTLPVADVDRAKAFYQRLGWRLDIDFKPTPDTRGVQFTPPGSPASIQFGEGRAPIAQGSLRGLLLIVEDIEAAREDLISRGVDVSEIWHTEPGKGQEPGIDPQRRSYFSRASFADPDGNTWELQEVTERLPGRVTSDVSARAQLLLETALRHGAFEAVAPPHDWWDWYAAYLDARERGINPDEASAVAGRYMEEERDVVVPR